MFPGIPSSQHNTPQAVPVCQKVTSSQGATHGVSNNRHSNTPQRQTLGMTDGGGHMTNARLGVGRQYLVRTNNPGGNSPSSSSSDTDIDDFPNRNPRQPNDGAGGGDRRGHGLGIVQRRRET